MYRLAVLLCLLPALLSASEPIRRTSKPKSNPSQVAGNRRGNSADLAFQQSMFGSELVNKVKKGAIYIWSMTPMEDGFLAPSSIGSGFIFQAIPEENAAYALTNHHVAADNTSMQVETWDHGTYKAEIVALAPGIDVALIKIHNIPPSSYEVNVLGDSDKVQIGEPALALGAPGARESTNTNRSDPWISAGLHQTATMRVVSGKQTDPMEFVRTRPGWQRDLGWQVMTNTPWRFVCQSTINPGNSGGPLYNARGEVIGLNHAHFSGSGGPLMTQNQNYTIPINFAKHFAYQILNTGKYEVPWFGMDILIPPDQVHGASVSEWLEKHYDPKKLRVLGVRHNSPAEKAGLMRGDEIVEFDGQVFPTSTDLRLYIFGLPIGKEVPVTVKRSGAKKELVIETAPKRNYDAEFSF